MIGGSGALSESWLKDKSPENCLSSVEIYDPETNSWTAGPELLVPLCAMGVVKYYGTIYVLGIAWHFFYWFVACYCTDYISDGDGLWLPRVSCVW